MVVSDHGIKRMDGGFCVNQWLQQQGLLAIQQQPPGIVKLSECTVDWSRTKAWGDGGYYARIYLNVRGREPAGTIRPSEYEEERNRLKAALEATTDPNGQPLGTVVLKPEEAYRETNGVAPDLIVYFGNLAWRSVGTLGHPGIHTFENDTGPDDANHAQHGLVIISDPRCPMNGLPLTGLQLERIGPTLLDWLGVEAPSTMMGRPIHLPSPLSSAAGSNGRNESLATGVSVASGGYTVQEEELMNQHLAALGYVE
jgi:predicted AlkP superfamily phosphohydrolase/phosphomutase